MRTDSQGWKAVKEAMRLQAFNEKVQEWAIGTAVVVGFLAFALFTSVTA